MYADTVLLGQLTAKEKGLGKRLCWDTTDDNYSVMQTVDNYNYNNLKVSIALEWSNNTQEKLHIYKQFVQITTYEGQQLQDTQYH